METFQQIRDRHLLEKHRLFKQAFRASGYDTKVAAKRLDMSVVNFRNRFEYYVTVSVATFREKDADRQHLKGLLEGNK